MRKVHRRALLISLLLALSILAVPALASARSGGRIFTLSAAHATSSVRGKAVVLRFRGASDATAVDTTTLLPRGGALSPAATVSGVRRGALVTVEDFNSHPDEDSLTFRLRHAVARGSHLTLRGIRVGAGLRTRVRRSFNEPDLRLPGRMTNVTVTIDTDPSGPSTHRRDGVVPVLVTATSPPRGVANASAYDSAVSAPGQLGQLIDNQVEGFELDCEMYTDEPNPVTVAFFAYAGESRSPIPGLVGPQGGANLNLTEPIDKYGEGPTFGAPEVDVSLHLPAPEHVIYEFEVEPLGDRGIQEAAGALCRGSVTGPELADFEFTPGSEEEPR